MILARWVNLDRALREQAGIADRISTQVVVRVLNKEIVTGRTAGVREIRKQVALKAGYVRERLVIRRATRQRTEAEISANPRGILLTRYPNRAVRRGARGGGVRVTVKPGRSKRMPGAFYVRLRAGSEVGAGAMGIAVRTGAGRYPLKVLKGPSVEQVFRDTRAAIAPEMLKRTERDVARQMALEIRRTENRS